MYRLKRFYLDSCGVTDNRFVDLTVELTDAAGEPTDAIVWLRNGAGKTTMLSLLLALILPDRRDFLATRTKNRNLEDLIADRDTAHVVAEWVSPEGHVLLTGAVYEWDGRHRPTDYATKGKERLRRSWWCINPEPTVEGATLETLPFTHRTRGTYDRERFCAHIAGLTALGVDAVVASQSIQEWHMALRERRFDPDLFHYFTEVNAAEGGIEELFADIDSPGKFVRYLLRFVGNHQRVAPVRDLLSETAAEIAKQPIYLQERRFCQEARPHVEALGAAKQAVRQAAAIRAETRRRAAELKRALLDMATTATARHAAAAQRAADADTQVRTIRSTIDAARDKRDEYARIAAKFRLDTARTARESAQSQVGDSQLDTTAWKAVDDYIALQVRKTELSARQKAQASASEDARPLLRNLEEAKARLAGALQNEIAKSEAALAEIRDRLAAVTQDQADAQNQWDEATQRLAALESERDTLHSLLARFDNDRRHLATEGVLGEGETLLAAQIRLRGEHEVADSTTRRLQTQRQSLHETIAITKKQLQHDRAAASSAEDAHRAVATQLQQLTERAHHLADNARLRTLLQTDAVDLDHAAHDAIAALESAEATADNELIALKQRIAQGERAIHALRTTGLLPPRLGVEKVLHDLDAAGVTAHSGWQYLANHVDTAQHCARIAELPGAVDGVIIYHDDPTEVTSRLSSTVDELVVVSPATVFTDPHQPQHVLGPAAAQHDKTAAAAELRTRSTRYEADNRLRSALTRQLGDDAELRHRLVAFQNDLPPDGLAGLRVKQAATAAELAAAQQREQDTSDALEQHRAHGEELTSQISESNQRSARLAGWRPRVDNLAADEHDHVEPAKHRLLAIPRDRQAANRHAAQAKRRRETAGDTLAELKAQQRSEETKLQNWRSRRAPLPSAAATDQPLDAAETDVAVAEDNLHKQYPHEALHTAIQRAEHEVQAAARAWNRHQHPVQQRAIELANTAAAADDASRREAAERASTRYGQANQILGEANTELEEAQQEYANAGGERPGKAAIDLRRPTDRREAELFMAEAEEQMRIGEAERNRQEQFSRAAHYEAKDAETRTAMLKDRAAMLRGIEPAATATVSLPDDDAHIREVTDRMAADLDAAEDLCAGTEQDFNHCADALFRWAGKDNFLKVAEDEHGGAVRQLRDMFREKAQIDRVADRARELLHDLQVRENAISQQLAQVETHKNHVVTRMGDLVTEALGIIGRASTLSELPAGIGPWQHHKFLVVEPKSKPSHEQITLRVADLVDTMVNAGRIEVDPAELLWKATEASVLEGFRASVLKPAPDQPTGRTPVEDMRKWSGGENLTASLLLFCVLARLRAEQRTGTKSGITGGVLPLDNPLGKANYQPFLELQRRVARANGVQLVFWTGIGDLGAVTLFPRIAAMHKRPSTTRPGRAYVQVDGEHSQILDLVSAVRSEP
jgi:hypothetical protein